jgi:predicted TIM-barrel fold metal-dependent hydrolase
VSATVTGVDTHAHVIDPARFAYASDAAYRPQGQEIGPLERYLAVLDSHGISHAVVVQPTSGYLFDNRCMLDAVTRSNGRLRAIVRVPPSRARAHEAVLDAPGVVGVRLDLIGDGIDVVEAADMSWLIAAMRERGLQLQVQCEGDQLTRALAVVAAARAPVVIDHCGRPVPSRGLAQPGFATLLALGRDGHVVKLRGPFRFSEQEAPFLDCAPFVEALVETFTPDRCRWGSDWPYLRIAGRLDYGPEFDLLARWVPDPAARRRILVDTPARLFSMQGVQP